MTVLQARAALTHAPSPARIAVELDLGPHHGGWVAIDAWTATEPLELAQELLGHGWALAAEPHGDLVAVEPTDWALILRAATTTKALMRQRAERVDTAWNLLVAEAPSKEQGGLSVIQIAELSDVGRHRIYALRGLGKSRPKFSLDD